MKSVGGVPTWCPALPIRKGRNMNDTKCIHHWIPMTTGKRNAQGEPIQQHVCRYCNITHAAYQGMGSPE